MLGRAVHAYECVLDVVGRHAVLLGRDYLRDIDHLHSHLRWSRGGLQVHSFSIALISR